VSKKGRVNPLDFGVEHGGFDLAAEVVMYASLADP
jgi:hypothetical protein